MILLLLYVFASYLFMFGLRNDTPIPLGTVLIAPLYAPFALGCYVSAQLNK